MIADRFEGRYKTVSGKIMTHEEIEHQISNILTGLYSLGGHRDRALIEYRVTPDPIFKSISYEGVPDIRIIVLMGYPIMAMLRLPTRQSGGRPTCTRVQSASAWIWRPVSPFAAPG